MECSQVVFTSGNGPQGGWLDEAYSFLTFGLWSFCEGIDNTIGACSDPKIGYTLGMLVLVVSFNFSFLRA